ncbi:MAG: hypothetical protein ABIP12_01690 [Terriglobales bacterium]
MTNRIKELGDAINQTLSNSEQIADVIGRIKDEGYDVFLVLEATVGFNRQDSKDNQDSPRAAATVNNVTQMPTPEAELKVNAQDLRFLKSLRISVDDAA